MSKKIFTTILICLIMILNIFMPTIALAAANTVNEVKKDDQINQNEEITDSENNVVDDVENTENKSDNEISNEETNATNNNDEITEDNETTIDNENTTVGNENAVDNENSSNTEKEENSVKENITKEENSENVIPTEENTVEKQELTEEKSDAEVSVSYRSHVQDEYWQEYVSDGTVSGTTGMSRRIEAMEIQLQNNTSEDFDIEYQVHIQDIGWQDWKKNGEMAGTTGQSLRIEAIRINLESSDNYTVMYRVHAEDYGWMDWKTDGEMAGTTGENKRIEAIEIKIVEKQRKARLCIDTPIDNETYYSSETPNLTVSGWKMANLSNTYIKAYVDNKEVDSNSITYTKRQDVIDGIIDYGTKEQNPNPGFSFNLNTSNFEAGNHIIKIEVYYNDIVLTTMSVTINYDKDLHVQYKVHGQDYDWQEWKKDGEMAGTTGQNKRVEALELKLVNNNIENLNIKYQVHGQDYDWQDWKTDGEMAGTTGQSLRIEAIKIELENPQDYSIMYRVHIQDIGWQDWKKDGKIAGTTGRSLRIEAIEVKIVKKEKKGRLYIDLPINGGTYYTSETSSILVSGWKMANVPDTYIKAYLDGEEIKENNVAYAARQDVIDAITGYGTIAENPTPGYQFYIETSELESGNHNIKIELCYKEEVLASENTTFCIDSSPHIQYTAHVQDEDWQDWKADGNMTGTTGQDKRIEALKIKLVNVPSSAHIKYRVYVQGLGWTDYVQDGEMAGTTGQSKRIQAVQIQLEGLDGYVVEYSAHVQLIDWQPWVSNGMEAGTSERSLRLEALKIRLVKEEESIVPEVKYSVHNCENGWINYKENGEVIGNTSGELKLDAIKVALENTKTASIKYRIHVQEEGWLTEVSNDQQTGTANEINGIEAIEISLDGLDDYSIEYRVYIIGQGWQNWVNDGETAGTTGKNLQISAIQIKIVIKDSNKNLSNFSSLDESKYPGYKEKLQKLQEQYPNWIITIDYTGLDWSAVLDGEQQMAGTQPKSLTQAGNEWRDGDTEYQPGWYKASRTAIAYMMDPRNSLDDEYIFQFQDLTSSAGRYSDIEKMIQGSYLTEYEKNNVTTTESIINTILSSAETYSVSPYHLTSRMLQEQGTNGTPLSDGYLYDGAQGERIVYNLFNIKATGATKEEIWQNGASYAYDNRWFSPELCINGSASFLNNGYLKRGQATLYYQKYNVVAYPYYENQYMQNIRAANDEGQRIAKEYKENGLIKSEFEFTIPVFENMPKDAASRPST